MADQNRNQSNQNISAGQRGQHADDPNQVPLRDDESLGVGGSGGRSNRKPASTADDRGMGDSRRNVDNVDELDGDTSIESDIDDADEER